MPVTHIDFNCDLGEGGDDAALLPFLSSASLACGFHAGDPASITRTIALCLAHDVAIGAHPSLFDRDGFGRRELPVTPDEAHALTLYQIGALQALTKAAGTVLHHVKPHGALYNLSARNRELAKAIACAVRDADPGLILYGLAGSESTAAGERLGLRVAHEVFAERRYETDGRLTPRGTPGAVIETLDESLAQVRQLLRDGNVTARTGERLPLRADTLCLHGDRPDAADFARALHRTLRDEGISMRAMGVDG